MEKKLSFFHHFHHVLFSSSQRNEIPYSLTEWFTCVTMVNLLCKPNTLFSLHFLQFYRNEIFNWNVSSDRKQAFLSHQSQIFFIIIIIFCINTYLLKNWLFMLLCLNYMSEMLDLYFQYYRLTKPQNHKGWNRPLKII